MEQLLRELQARPRHSLAETAIRLGWFTASGAPNKQRVHREIRKLIRQGALPDYQNEYKNRLLHIMMQMPELASAAQLTAVINRTPMGDHLTRTRVHQLLKQLAAENQVTRQGRRYFSKAFSGIRV